MTHRMKSRDRDCARADGHKGRCLDVVEKAARAERARLIAADPEVQKKRSATLMLPENREKNSRRCRERSNNPEYLENYMRGREKMKANPVWQSNTRAAARRRANDPEWQRAFAIGMEKRSRNDAWRASVRASWDDPDRKARFLQAVAKRNQDPVYRERNAEHLRRLCRLGQSSGTRPEGAMVSLLEYAEIEFVHQYPIGRYIVDFYLPESNSVIEVDGVHWHPDGPDEKRDAVLYGQGVSHIAHITDMQLRQNGWI